MSDAAARIATEMQTDYSRSFADRERKRAADALEKEKQSYRLQVEAQAEVANEQFWSRPGRWSDAEYHDLIAQLPPRPPVK